MGIPTTMIKSGLILGLHPANERRRYFVTPSLICWAQTWNQPCKMAITPFYLYNGNSFTDKVASLYCNIHTFFHFKYVVEAVSCESCCFTQAAFTSCGSSLLCCNWMGCIRFHVRLSCLNNILDNFHENYNNIIEICIIYSKVDGYIVYFTQLHYVVALQSLFECLSQYGMNTTIMFISYVI